MTPFKLTLNNLFNFLTKNNYLPELQNETNQIYVLIKKANTELALFFRVLGDGELLQIVTYLPLKIKNESTNEVARLLHKINNDLDVPGFCLSEPSQLIFYRLVVPCLDKMCSPALLLQYLKIAPQACSTCIHVIASVANGAISFDDLLKKGS